MTALTHRDTTDRLAAAKLWLVSTTSTTTCGNLPYLATALYSLITVTTSKVTSMSVDRYWRLYANPEWVLATEVPDIAAKLSHLTWHLLADHANRAHDVDVHAATASSWKQATDATIAELLQDVQHDLAPPHGLGLTPGRSAEEYYAQLSRLPIRPIGGSGAPTDADSDEPDQTCGGGCDGLERDYELPVNADIGAVGNAHADEVRRRVAIEFREHQAAIGTEPGDWERWVNAILDPVIPWSTVLAAAVRRGIGWAHGHADYTYTRVSRRQSSAGRVILPATRRPIPEIAIVLDTSGSVDDGLLAQALGEIDGVLTGMGVSGQSVHVLVTDAIVHDSTSVRAASDIRLIGGGGTDMGEGIHAALQLRPRPTLIIVLTDGYTPWPELPPPTPVIAGLIARQATELPATPAWVQRIEILPH